MSDSEIIGQEIQNILHHFSPVMGRGEVKRIRTHTFEDISSLIIIHTGKEKSVGVGLRVAP